MNSNLVTAISSSSGSNIEWAIEGSFTTGDTLAWTLEEKPDKIFLQGKDTPVYYYYIIMQGSSDIYTTIPTSSAGTDVWYITNSDYLNYYGIYYWDISSNTLTARFLQYSSYWSIPSKGWTITQGDCDYCIVKYKE